MVHMPTARSQTGALVSDLSQLNSQLHWTLFGRAKKYWAGKVEAFAGVPSRFGKDMEKDEVLSRTRRDAGWSRQESALSSKCQNKYTIRMGAKRTSSEPKTEASGLILEDISEQDRRERQMDGDVWPTLTAKPPRPRTVPAFPLAEFELKLWSFARGVEKISDEIELQKKFLAKLLSDKSLVQRQLNAVLDPVARLPPEISSDIFSTASLPSQRWTSLRPMLAVAQIPTSFCFSLSAMLGQPWLYPPRIYGPLSTSFSRALKASQRSSRPGCNALVIVPCSISLRGNLDDLSVSAIYAIIWKHGQQVRSLEICADTENEDTENEEEHGIGHVDLFLGMLKIGSIAVAPNVGDSRTA
ncbi:hypothetical protein B0H14DRAFT_3173603 [Mycena olivaceomarginata]|nr:hypothetical protein B0H14DRAFT_3173603 [Mycena olivaceomarginata]